MPRKTKTLKKTDLKSKKPWLRKRCNSRYPIENVEPNKIILIVCEGQTEKHYFESFPVYGVKIHFEDTKGQSKQQLITITYHKVKNSKIEYDDVWCVFDMDVNNGDKEFADFDNAIQSGIKREYKIAYSNDAFELWFYLHYHYITNRENRKFYYQKLGKIWNINYVKEGKRFNFSKNIYKKLEDDDKASQDQAIRNAEKLFNLHKNKMYHEQNPVTTVYKLVRYLNNNLRP